MAKNQIYLDADFIPVFTKSIGLHALRNIPCYAHYNNNNNFIYTLH